MARPDELERMQQLGVTSTFTAAKLGLGAVERTLVGDVAILENAP